MKRAIGVIANPASGKDIRRLVAYGAISDNLEKVNMIRRVIMGARSMGVTDLYYMPDYFGIVPTALDGMYADHKAYVAGMRIHRLDMPMTGTEADSTAASRIMRELEVECVIVLGGDGTSRAVAKESGDTALIPISTGTNNVFPRHLEGTIAGMAAGAYVSGELPDTASLVIRSKRLDIYRNGQLEDIALIDAVVMEDQEIASRAIWSAEPFRQILLTRCSAHYIGVSSIGGQLSEIEPDEPYGYVIQVGPAGTSVRAPIAPGLFVDVPVACHRPLHMGEQEGICQVPCIIAVDGERNVSFFRDDKGYIELTWKGPILLQVEKTLRAARASGLFQNTLGV